MQTEYFFLTLDSFFSVLQLQSSVKYVVMFQKSTFLNSNSIGNSRATGLSVEDCYVLPSLNKVNLFMYPQAVQTRHLTVDSIDKRI